MNVNRTVEYWHRVIKADGLVALERRLPYMTGKKLCAAKRAIQEHEDHQAQNSADRTENRETKANKIAGGAGKRTWWVLWIALATLILAGIDRYLDWQEQTETSMPSERGVLAPDEDSNQRVPS